MHFIISSVCLLDVRNTNEFLYAFTPDCYVAVIKKSGLRRHLGEYLRIGRQNGFFADDKLGFLAEDESGFYIQLGHGKNGQNIYRIKDSDEISTQTSNPGVFFKEYQINLS